MCLNVNMNYLRSNLSRFKLITFDVTDTLLEYAVRPERHYAQTINNILQPHMGLPVDEKAVIKSFGSCFRSMKSQYPNFGYSRKNPDSQDNREESWHWWWRTLVERVILEAASQSNCNNIPSNLLTTIAEQLIDDYTFDAKRICWRKCPGVDQFMHALREPMLAGNYDKQKVLGVVSNFDPRLNTILRNNGISSSLEDKGNNHKMDFIVTSYDVGVEKPEPKIFEIALKRASRQSHTSDVQPHEALHIGNLYREDYFGARSAGWQALLVNMPEAKRNREAVANIPREHIFSGLPELQERLENDASFPWATC